METSNGGDGCRLVGIGTGAEDGDTEPPRLEVEPRPSAEAERLGAATGAEFAEV